MGLDLGRFFKRRIYLRYFLKIVRGDGTPESLGRAVAVGMFTGFAVPIGGQIIPTLLLAFIFKANRAVALLATFPTNPWTAPFVYPVQYLFGAWVMGKHPDVSRFEHEMKMLLESKEGALEAAKNLGADFVVPFLVAGLIWGVVWAVVGYFATIGLVLRHREKKRLRLLKALSVKRDPSHPIELSDEPEK